MGQTGPLGRKAKLAKSIRISLNSCGFHRGVGLGAPRLRALALRTHALASVPVWVGYLPTAGARVGRGLGVVSGGGQWWCGGQTPLPARGAAVAKCREETDPAPAAGGRGRRERERVGARRGSEPRETPGGALERTPAREPEPRGIAAAPLPEPVRPPSPLRLPPPGLGRMEDSRETSPSSNNSSEELSSALQLSKGMSIFLDVSTGRRSWVGGPPASFLFPRRRAVGSGCGSAAGQLFCRDCPPAHERELPPTSLPCPSGNA